MVKVLAGRSPPLPPVWIGLNQCVHAFLLLKMYLCCMSSLPYMYIVLPFYERKRLKVPTPKDYSETGYWDVRPHGLKLINNWLRPRNDHRWPYFYSYQSNTKKFALHSMAELRVGRSGLATCRRIILSKLLILQPQIVIICFINACI